MGLEAALTLVLFVDASRIDVRALHRELDVPARLLGIGLPLTIAAGTLVALALLSSLSFAEALVLAIVLAPTDAALGRAVVTCGAHRHDRPLGLRARLSARPLTDRYAAWYEAHPLVPMERVEVRADPWRCVTPRPPTLDREPGGGGA